MMRSWHKHIHPQQTSSPHHHTIDNPLNPHGVGWVNFFRWEPVSSLSAHVCQIWSWSKPSCRKKARLTLTIDIEVIWLSCILAFSTHENHLRWPNDVHRMSDWPRHRRHRCILRSTWSDHVSSQSNERHILQLTWGYRLSANALPEPEDVFAPSSRTWPMLRHLQVPTGDLRVPR